MVTSGLRKSGASCLLHERSPSEAGEGALLLAETRGHNRYSRPAAPEIRLGDGVALASASQMSQPPRLLRGAGVAHGVSNAAPRAHLL